MLLPAPKSLFATDLANLAELYRDQDRPAEAEPLFERALAIREKVLGPEHPDTKTIRGSLRSLHDNSGRSKGALTMFDLEVRGSRSVVVEHLTNLIRL